MHLYIGWLWAATAMVEFCHTRLQGFIQAPNVKLMEWSKSLDLRFGTRNIMKKLIFTIVALISLSAITGQNKYLTKTGLLAFEASVPSFEEVAAKNNSVTAILNTETGDYGGRASDK